MRILVLGGNGFVGSHLVEALISEGAKVRVFDRPGSLKGDTLRNVEYCYGDFGDVSMLNEAMVNIDLLIHLISSTVPGTSNVDPVADIQVNLVNSVRMLEQMQKVNVKRILFLSSGGTVYGNPKSLPASENHLLNPISSYGILKVAIENYLRMYEKLYDIKPTILRVANLYGPRQSHIGIQGVIHTFFRRIIENEQIHIWGDGSNIRDFIYIDDFIRAAMIAIKKNVVGVFNIGSGQGTCLRELVKIIGDVSGIVPQVKYLPARPFDVNEIVLDISKAKSVMGWTPLIKLKQGCELYFNWLIRNLETPY